MTPQRLSHRIKNSLRILYQFHGIWFPFVLIHRSLFLCYRKWFAPATFAFDGETYAYEVHPYSLNNERIVEVPVARALVANAKGEILEVGNVLSHYFHFPHDVVDKYEQAPGVINEDIVAYAPGKQYSLILTISTLEHVGWDETPRDIDKIHTAIARLKTLLSPGGQLVATFPLGYNPHVDAMIREGASGFTKLRFMLRTSSCNAWREATWEEVQSCKFGSPFPCANAVAFCYC